MRGDKGWMLLSFALYEQDEQAKEPKSQQHRVVFTLIVVQI